MEKNCRIYSDSETSEKKNSREKTDKETREAPDNTRSYFCSMSGNREETTSSKAYSMY